MPKPRPHASQREHKEQAECSEEKKSPKVPRRHHHHQKETGTVGDKAAAVVVRGTSSGSQSRLDGVTSGPARSKHYRLDTYAVQYVSGGVPRQVQLKVPVLQLRRLDIVRREVRVMTRSQVPGGDDSKAKQRKAASVCSKPKVPAPSDGRHIPVRVTRNGPPPICKAGAACKKLQKKVSPKGNKSQAQRQQEIYDDVSDVPLEEYCDASGSADSTQANVTTDAAVNKQCQPPHKKHKCAPLDASPAANKPCEPPHKKHKGAPLEDYEDISDTPLDEYDCLEKPVQSASVANATNGKVTKAHGKMVGSKPGDHPSKERASSSKVLVNKAEKKGPQEAQSVVKTSAAEVQPTEAKSNITRSTLTSKPSTSSASGKDVVEKGAVKRPGMPCKDHGTKRLKTGAAENKTESEAGAVQKSNSSSSLTKKEPPAKPASKLSPSAKNITATCGLKGTPATKFKAGVTETEPKTNTGTSSVQKINCLQASSKAEPDNLVRKPMSCGESSSSVPTSNMGISRKVPVPSTSKTPEDLTEAKVKHGSEDAHGNSAPSVAKKVLPSKFEKKPASSTKGSPDMPASKPSCSGAPTKDLNNAKTVKSVTGAKVSPPVAKKAPPSKPMSSPKETLDLAKSSSRGISTKAPLSSLKPVNDAAKVKTINNSAKLKVGSSTHVVSTMAKEASSSKLAKRPVSCTKSTSEASVAASAKALKSAKETQSSNVAAEADKKPQSDPKTEHIKCANHFGSFSNKEAVKNVKMEDVNASGSKTKQCSRTVAPSKDLLKKKPPTCSPGGIEVKTSHCKLFSRRKSPERSSQIQAAAERLSSASDCDGNKQQGIPETVAAKQTEQVPKAVKTLPTESTESPVSVPDSPKTTSPSSTSQSSLQQYTVHKGSPKATELQSEAAAPTKDRVRKGPASDIVDTVSETAPCSSGSADKDKSLHNSCMPAVQEVLTEALVRNATSLAGARDVEADVVVCAETTDVPTEAVTPTKGNVSKEPTSDVMDTVPEAAPHSTDSADMDESYLHNSCVPAALTEALERNATSVAGVGDVEADVAGCVEAAEVPTEAVTPTKYHVSKEPTSDILDTVLETAPYSTDSIDMDKSYLHKPCVSPVQEVLVEALERNATIVVGAQDVEPHVTGCVEDLDIGSEVECQDACPAKDESTIHRDDGHMLQNDISGTTGQSHKFTVLTATPDDTFPGESTVNSMYHPFGHRDKSTSQLVHGVAGLLHEPGITDEEQDSVSASNSTRPAPSKKGHFQAECCSLPPTKMDVEPPANIDVSTSSLIEQSSVSCAEEGSSVSPWNKIASDALVLRECDEARDMLLEGASPPSPAGDIPAGTTQSDGEMPSGVTQKGLFQAKCSTPPSTEMDVEPPVNAEVSAGFSTKQSSANHAQEVSSVSPPNKTAIDALVLREQGEARDMLLEGASPPSPAGNIPAGTTQSDGEMPSGVTQKGLFQAKCSTSPSTKMDVEPPVNTEVSPGFSTKQSSVNHEQEGSSVSPRNKTAIDALVLREHGKACDMLLEGAGPPSPAGDIPPGTTQSYGETPSGVMQEGLFQAECSTTPSTKMDVEPPTNTEVGPGSSTKQSSVNYAQEGSSVSPANKMASDALLLRECGEAHDMPIEGASPRSPAGTTQSDGEMPSDVSQGDLRHTDLGITSSQDPASNSIGADKRGAQGMNSSTLLASQAGLQQMDQERVALLQKPLCSAKVAKEIYDSAPLKVCERSASTADKTTIVAVLKELIDEVVVGTENRDACSSISAGGSFQESEEQKSSPTVSQQGCAGECLSPRPTAEKDNEKSIGTCHPATDKVLQQAEDSGAVFQGEESTSDTVAELPQKLHGEVADTKTDGDEGESLQIHEYQVEAKEPNAASSPETQLGFALSQPLLDTTVSGGSDNDHQQKEALKSTLAQEPQGDAVTVASSLRPDTDGEMSDGGNNFPASESGSHIADETTLTEKHESKSTVNTGPSLGDTKSSRRSDSSSTDGISSTQATDTSSTDETSSTRMTDSCLESSEEAENVPERGVAVTSDQDAAVPKPIPPKKKKKRNSSGTNTSMHSAWLFSRKKRAKRPPKKKQRQEDGSQATEPPVAVETEVVNSHEAADSVCSKLEGVGSKKEKPPLATAGEVEATSDNVILGGIKRKPSYDASQAVEDSKFHTGRQLQVPTTPCARTNSLMHGALLDLDMFTGLNILDVCGTSAENLKDLKARIVSQSITKNEAVAKIAESVHTAVVEEYFKRERAVRTLKLLASVPCSFDPRDAGKIRRVTQSIAEQSQMCAKVEL